MLASLCLLGLRATTRSSNRTSGFDRGWDSAVKDGERVCPSWLRFLSGYRTAVGRYVGLGGLPIARYNSMLKQGRLL